MEKAKESLINQRGEMIKELIHGIEVANKLQEQLFISTDNNDDIISIDNNVISTDNNDIISIDNQLRDDFAKSSLNRAYISEIYENKRILINKILSCFDKTITMAKLMMVQAQGTTCSVLESPPSQNSHHFSKKRKKNPTEMKRISVEGSALGSEGTLGDGYGWRKYGQKIILGAKFPRVVVLVAMGRLAVVVAAVVVVVLGHICECKCEIKGIFNFGDSNTDTGGFFAAFPEEKLPYGMTYFGKPVGRASDGRVIVDFLAQAIGIAMISPYLKAIGSDFRHGANFATAASTVRLPQTSLFVTGVSPFSLSIQLNQLKFLHSSILQLDNSSKLKGPTPLPSISIFGKALYTFYIGQNDFTGNLANLGISGVKKFLPQVISQIIDTIKDIYENVGGRTFWVLNLAPIGCYPAFLVELPHEESDLDRYGCMISYNNEVRDYNNMLKIALNNIRKDLANASLIYVDVHSILLHLFQHPSYYGLKYGTRACCGQGGDPYNFNPNIYCGNTKTINGTTLSATPCEDPYNYVSWDGIHSTEVANKFVTLAILNGSLFDPPFPLDRLCDINPIG